MCPCHIGIPGRAAELNRHGPVRSSRVREVAGGRFAAWLGECRQRIDQPLAGTGVHLRDDLGDVPSAVGGDLSNQRWRSPRTRVPPTPEIATFQSTTPVELSTSSWSRTRVES